MNINYVKDEQLEIIAGGAPNLREAGLLEIDIQGKGGKKLVIDFIGVGKDVDLRGLVRSGATLNIIARTARVLVFTYSYDGPR